jgi:serine/threonine protein kinase
MIDYYSEEKAGYVNYYILMENCGSILLYLYLDGTLQEALQRLRNEKNSFPENQIWRMLHHLGIGLKHIHAKKYAHRGIRAENVLITMDNQYKIYDFSSATNKSYEVSNNVTVSF